MALAFLVPLISNSAWRASWPSFFQELKMTLEPHVADRRPGKLPKKFLDEQSQVPARQMKADMFAAAHSLVCFSVQTFPIHHLLALSSDSNSN